MLLSDPNRNANVVSKGKTDKLGNYSSLVSALIVVLD